MGVASIKLTVSEVFCFFKRVQRGVNITFTVHPSNVKKELLFTRIIFNSFEWKIPKTEVQPIS